MNTQYEVLHSLCGRLPAQYVDQSRARLWSVVEGMTLREADERLDLRLGQHGLLPCGPPRPRGRGELPRARDRLLGEPHGLSP